MKARTKVLGIVSILGSFFVSISGTLPKSGSASNANLSFTNSTIGGYIKDGDNKKQIVSFASTVTGDDVNNITEYGINVYSNSSCVSAIYTKSSTNTTHLISKEGRFYTVIGDDEEISKDTTYYAKAYAVVGGTTYSSDVMNAKGNDNKEYTFSGTYQISVSAATGGTVTGSGNYSSGDSCTVVATASTGYTFDGWYENDTKIEGADASYTFTVSASRTLTAKFTPNTYTITTSVTNGSYSGSTQIKGGGTATVTLKGNTGYNVPSSITVSGADYTYSNGVVSLSNPSGNVSIKASAEAKLLTPTCTINSLIKNVSLVGTISAINVTSPVGTTFNIGTFKNDGTANQYVNVSLRDQNNNMIIQNEKTLYSGQSATFSGYLKEQYASYLINATSLKVLMTLA